MNKKERFYSKEKCPCISGKRIIGMGQETDEHLWCHNCGAPLFPWERHSKYCNCSNNPYRDNDEPKDRLKQWNYPNYEEFNRLKKEEEILKENIWKKNLTLWDKFKINIGIKCENDYVNFTLDEVKRGLK